MDKERAEKIRLEWLEGVKRTGLVTIVLKENQLTSIELAELLGCSPGTAARRAEKLEKRGMIKLLYKKVTVDGMIGLHNVYELMVSKDQSLVLSEDNNLQST